MGFAAVGESVLQNGPKKLRRSCSIYWLPTTSHSQALASTFYNIVTILTRDGHQLQRQTTQSEVAHEILNQILTFRKVETAIFLRTEGSLILRKVGFKRLSARLVNPQRPFVKASLRIAADQQPSARPGDIALIWGLPALQACLEELTWFGSTLLKPSWFSWVGPGQMKMPGVAVCGSRRTTAHQNHRSHPAYARSGLHLQHREMPSAFQPNSRGRRDRRLFAFRVSTDREHPPASHLLSGSSGCANRSWNQDRGGKTARSFSRLSRHQSHAHLAPGLLTPQP